MEVLHGLAGFAFHHQQTRRGQSSFRSGRTWAAVGHEVARLCSLGQLDRQLEDDSSRASRSGGHHAHICLSEELRVVGHAAPEWRPLATALPRRLAARLPGVLGIPDEGWQHDVSSFTERLFLNSSIWLQLGGGERAMLLSGLPFMALPVSEAENLD